jgi:hypothetical protein
METPSWMREKLLPKWRRLAYHVQLLLKPREPEVCQYLECELTIAPRLIQCGIEEGGARELSVEQ